jgi:L-lactate dehydrogenase
MNNKVVIIGCGNVGMSYAYSIVNQRTYVNELVLIDMNQDKVMGEVMDLNHSLAYAPSKLNIKAGTYDDCKDARIVMIAAGANQKPGETRLDLLNKNTAIFKDIIGKVMNSGFNGIFLIATNPVDIMTFITWKYSGLPANRVIGSGTSLDTARLHYMVGQKLEINPKDIDAFVIGEHGDSEFIPWSNANISLQNIRVFLDEMEMEAIEKEVREAAYKIINYKGATYYGIGMALTSITNSILGDENLIYSVSVYDKQNNIFFGCPAVVGKRGIKQKIYLKLTNVEEQKLLNSIDIIKSNINLIK